MRSFPSKPYILLASFRGGRFAFASDTILSILLSETVGNAFTALANRSRSIDSAKASVFGDWFIA